MEENETTEVKNNNTLWMSHAIVVVITVVILVVLLTLQPWSGSAITIVNSFRANMSASDFGGDMMGEVTQEVAFMAPDRSHIIITVMGEKQEIIVIGGDLYANNAQYVSGFQGWALTTSIAAMTPSNEHTETTLDQLSDIEERAVEVIDGVNCRHYRGRIDFAKQIEEQIASLDPEQSNYEMMVEALEMQVEAMQEIKTDIGVWVGKDDGLVRQVYYEARVPTEDGKSVSSTVTVIRYFDINAAITIEPPLDSYGELLQGWYQSSF
jgi:hypothetical protein